jgi:hypothetical protein
VSKAATSTIINLLEVAALLTAFVSPAALAQDPVKSGGPGESDTWAPVKHLRFTDEDIQGGISDPDGVLIEVVPPAMHSSLIEIRQGFETEIVKTLEDF